MARGKMPLTEDSQRNSFPIVATCSHMQRERKGEETMEKRPKGKGVSRRDFLKGLSGGAVGAAAVSTGLLNPGRADAYPSELVGSA